MENIVKEFLKMKTFAVVGSFKDEKKTAYMIVKDLLFKGHVVYPVNPNTKEVEGLKVIQSVLDLPQGIDVVDLVTPPKSTREIVEQCLKKNIKNIWMQPGAESPEAIDFCIKNGMKVVYGFCVMKA